MTDFSSPPSKRFRLSATIVLVVASVISGVGAAYPQNTWLQVGPVIVAGVNRRLAYRLAILFVLASSAAYEIFEWTLAIMMSPEAAAAYNGQQGDIFDAQKDIWMATAGAIMGLLLLNRRYRGWRKQ